MILLTSTSQCKLECLLLQRIVISITNNKTLNNKLALFHITICLNSLIAQDRTKHRTEQNNKGKAQILGLKSSLCQFLIWRKCHWNKFKISLNVHLPQLILFRKCNLNKGIKLDLSQLRVNLKQTFIKHDRMLTLLKSNSEVAKSIVFEKPHNCQQK
jgi:hypothetical protein